MHKPPILRNQTRCDECHMTLWEYSNLFDPVSSVDERSRPIEAALIFFASLTLARIMTGMYKTLISEHYLSGSLLRIETINVGNRNILVEYSIGWSYVSFKPISSYATEIWECQIVILEGGLPTVAVVMYRRSRLEMPRERERYWFLFESSNWSWSFYGQIFRSCTSTFFSKIAARIVSAVTKLPFPPYRFVDQTHLKSPLLSLVSSLKLLSLPKQFRLVFVNLLHMFFYIMPCRRIVGTSNSLNIMRGTAPRPRIFKILVAVGSIVITVLPSGQNP